MSCRNIIICTIEMILVLHITYTDTDSLQRAGIYGDWEVGDYISREVTGDPDICVGLNKLYDKILFNRS